MKFYVKKDNTMNNHEEVVFITFEQAQELVERIAERVMNFDYTMSGPEKDAMANLLSDIGVKVSDLIDVSRLADEYAINALIVTPDEAKTENYTSDDFEDALFTWEEDGETYYCLQW